MYKKIIKTSEDKFNAIKLMICIIVMLTTIILENLKICAITCRVISVFMGLGILVYGGQLLIKSPGKR